MAIDFKNILGINKISKPGPEDSGLWRIIELLPIAIPIFLATLGLNLVVLLCLGLFSDALIWLEAIPLAVLVSVYVMRRVRLRTTGTIMERRIGMVVILLAALAWTIFNMHYSSENIYINRDPGAYNVTARWLMDNDNLVIHESHVFGKAPSLASDTAGYGEVKSDGDDRIYAQAPHLFPALIAVAGRLAGVDVMMKANVVIGAMALISVYGFIRTFVRPRWALVMVAVLSLSLPMFYFSRDTYTEPLAMLLVFGALSCMTAARATNTASLWAVTGIVAASSVLARIDAYLLLAGFIGALFIVASVDRRINKWSVISFLCGALVTGIVGWWDVYTLSRRYYIDLQVEFIAQIILIAVAVIGGGAIFTLQRRTSLVERLFKKYRNSLKWIVVAGVILGVGFLASRPLWLVSHEAGNPYSRPYVASLQAKAGDEIDPHRNYAEYSLYWVAWYIGPAVCALGLLGFFIVLRRIFEGRANNLIPAVLVVGLMAALYFVAPRITADQIWAIRRFMPVIIPGICLFAAIALQGVDLGIKTRKRKAVLWIVVVAVLFAPPLFISFPFYKNKEFAGQLAQIERLCKQLPSKSAVLLVGQNGINMTQTIRTYCDVPAERLPQPSKQSLSTVARHARSKGYHPVAFAIGYESGFLSSSKTSFTDVGSVVYQEVERELTHPPRTVDQYERVVLLATINNDGSVQPLEESTK